MPTAIFVNLPVKDLERSKTFFGKLGYSFNAQFTDANAACLVISDTIYAMLLTHKTWSELVPKPAADTSKGSEVSIALTMDNRAAVDELVRKAVAAGARALKAPMDMGFMYQHGFEDLDGHLWEAFYMDPTHVQPT